MQTDFLQPLLISFLLIAVPVFILITERKKRVRAAEGKLDGGIALFGYFLLLLSALMMCLTLWSAANLYVIWTTWADTEAEVVASEIKSSLVYVPGYGYMESFSTECTFRYTVAGQEFVVTSQSQSSRNEDFAERLLEQCAVGSKHAVHYQPSDAGVIGLVDGSGELILTSPYQARLALIFAALGCPLFLTAHLIYRRRKQVMGLT